MERLTFAERLAFARVVRLWATGSYPGNAEIGRAVARTGQAVLKWSNAAEPPTDYRVHEKLAAYLGVPERWLIRGEGEPPRQELWVSWRAERLAAAARAALRKSSPRPSATEAAGRARRAPEVPAETQLKVGPAPAEDLVKKMVAAKRRPKKA